MVSVMPIIILIACQSSPISASMIRIDKIPGKGASTNLVLTAITDLSPENIHTVEWSINAQPFIKWSKESNTVSFSNNQLRNHMVTPTNPLEISLLNITYNQYGIYRCEITTDEQTDSVEEILSIVKPPVCTLETKRLNACDTYMRLTCSEIYPKPVQSCGLSKENGIISTGITTDILQANDGSYYVSFEGITHILTNEEQRISILDILNHANETIFECTILIPGTNASSKVSRTLANQCEHIGYLKSRGQSVFDHIHTTFILLISGMIAILVLNKISG